MTLSKQAEQVIDMLRTNKNAGIRRDKEALAANRDPVLLKIENVYNERHMVDAEAAKKPLRDGLAAVPDLADGVPGEWLKYLDADPEKQRDKVILFLHGGGFATGSALARRVMIGNIAVHAKVDAFSPNYRLSPEHRFPAHVDDCVTAYLWLLKKGYAPKNIVVIGESAGANLALVLPLYLKDHHLPTPGGVCAFSPVVDLDGRYDSRVTRQNRDPMIGGVIEEGQLEEALAAYRVAPPDAMNGYCTAEELKCPYVSPIHGDFTGYPRLSIHVGSEELLHDDSIELERKARAAGVDVTLHEWEGLFHCFPIFDMPESDVCCEEIGQFIRSM